MGILISVKGAIDYFLKTGDILGAIIRVVLDTVVTLLVGVIVPWLAALSNAILPGLGPILVITAGILFSLWWSMLGGQEIVCNFLRDTIVAGSSWTYVS